MVDLSPRVGLSVAYVVSFLFALPMIVAPAGFMAQYNLDISDMRVTDKLLIMQVFQFQGVLLVMICINIRFAMNHGSVNTKALFSLLLGVSYLISTCIGLWFAPVWEEIGVPSAGIYFNCTLFTVIALLLLLGSSADGSMATNLAPLQKPLYWGFVAITILYALYVYANFFQTEALLDAYGVDVEGRPRKVLVAFFQTCIAPTMLNLVLGWVALMLSATIGATYGIARGLSMICMAMFITSASGMATWTALNEHGEYDKFIAGQRFNCLLWFVYLWLFYVPVCNMDADIFVTVESKVVKGREVRETDDGSSYMPMQSE